MSCSYSLPAATFQTDRRLIAISIRRQQWRAMSHWSRLEPNGITILRIHRDAGTNLRAKLRLPALLKIALEKKAQMPSTPGGCSFTKFVAQLQPTSRFRHTVDVRVTSNSKWLLMCCHKWRHNVHLLILERHTECLDLNTPLGVFHHSCWSNQISEWCLEVLKCGWIESIIQSINLSLCCHELY